MKLNEVSPALIYQAHPKECLHQLFDVNHTIAVRGYDQNRQVIFWNKGCERLYGYSKEEALGEKIETLIIPDAIKSQAIAAVNHAFTLDKAPTATELARCNKQGEAVPVYSTQLLLVNEENNKEIYCLDISLANLKGGNEKAEHRVNILDSTFKVIPDLFFVMEQDTTIVDYYACETANLYAPPEQFIGKLMTDVIPAEVADKFKANIIKLLAQQEVIHFEYEMTLPHGLVYFEARMTYLKESHKIITIVRDITAQHQAAESMRQHAYYDNLTTLPNRFLALDRLSQLINEAHRNNEKIALLFLDLDDFKKVNDTLGHEVGDKLLIESAKRLNQVVRKEDTVGRIAGDEFIVLLKGIIDEHNILSIVENLLKIFRKPFHLDGREVMVTLSIGISVYPDNGQSAKELLRNADTAMYQAKTLGRNTYSFFTKEMNTLMLRRLAIEEQMCGALEREEFQVYFQPQFEVKTKKMVGAEALLRWRNSDLGDITPAEFIPIAEQTGHIVVLGKFVLKQALAFLHQWHSQQSTQYKVAVNLSPRQFRGRDELSNFITQSLQDADIAAGSLELEITEGVLMNNQPCVDQALAKFKKLGIVLSMDDFGTGFSSLSYLQQYAFDRLKIDRCFINNIITKKRNYDLVKATIAMAHSLGLKVVAEGVESKAQVELLTQLQCDYIQGYYFSEPIPAKALIQFSINHLNKPLK